MIIPNSFKIIFGWETLSVTGFRSVEIDFDSVFLLSTNFQTIITSNNKLLDPDDMLFHIFNKKRVRWTNL